MSNLEKKIIGTDVFSFVSRTQGTQITLQPSGSETLYLDGAARTAYGVTGSNVVISGSESVTIDAPIFNTTALISNVITSSNLLVTSGLSVSGTLQQIQNFAVTSGSYDVDYINNIKYTHNKFITVYGGNTNLNVAQNVYIYHQDPVTLLWSRHTELTAPAGEVLFGYLGGDIFEDEVVIHAQGRVLPYNPKLYVYKYNRQTDLWSLTQTITSRSGLFDTYPYISMYLDVFAVWAQSNNEFGTYDIYMKNESGIYELNQSIDLTEHYAQPYALGSSSHTINSEFLFINIDSQGEPIPYLFVFSFNPVTRRYEYFQSIVKSAPFTDGQLTAEMTLLGPYFYISYQDSNDDSNHGDIYKINASTGLWEIYQALTTTTSLGSSHKSNGSTIFLGSDVYKLDVQSGSETWMLYSTSGGDSVVKGGIINRDGNTISVLKESSSATMEEALIRGTLKAAHTELKYADINYASLKDINVKNQTGTQHLNVYGTLNASGTTNILNLITPSATVGSLVASGSINSTSVSTTNLNASRSTISDIFVTNSFNTSTITGSGPNVTFNIEGAGNNTIKSGNTLASGSLVISSEGVNRSSLTLGSKCELTSFGDPINIITATNPVNITSTVLNVSSGLRVGTSATVPNLIASGATITGLSVSNGSFTGLTATSATIANLNSFTTEDIVANGLIDTYDITSVESSFNNSNIGLLTGTNVNMTNATFTSLKVSGSTALQGLTTTTLNVSGALNVGSGITNNSGQILAQPGIAANPGFAFSSDIGTGFYSNGPGNINIMSGGNAVFSTNTSNTLCVSTQFNLNAGGTAGLPKLSFDPDTNTGLRRSAEDTMAFSTGGTDRLVINNNGIIVTNGDLSVTGSSVLQGVTCGTLKATAVTTGTLSASGSSVLQGVTCATLRATATTATTNVSTGALVVSGGVGISGGIFAGGPSSLPKALLILSGGFGNFTGPATTLTGFTISESINNSTNIITLTGGSTIGFGVPGVYLFTFNFARTSNTTTQFFIGKNGANQGVSNMTGVAGILSMPISVTTSDTVTIVVQTNTTFDTYGRFTICQL